ncbi:MAG TPA: DUF1697 domain-containing protein [Acidimicrobiia bacterium]
MTTRVAFLRAVNLGQRRVAMSRLITVLEGLGSTDVWTFVNSGNAVFDASGSRAALERAIEDALHEDLGFEVETFVRTAAELRRAVGEQPFPITDGDTHFLTFLKAAPDGATSRALEQLSNDFDTLVVHGRDVHWRMRGKSTDSKLKKKDWEIVGKNASTSRNMTMLRRLVAKIDS